MKQLLFLKNCPFKVKYASFGFGGMFGKEYSKIGYRTSEEVF